MARVLGYGGLGNTNGARTFAGKAAAEVISLGLFAMDLSHVRYDTADTSGVRYDPIMDLSHDRYENE